MDVSPRLSYAASLPYVAGLSYFLLMATPTSRPASTPQACLYTAGLPLHHRCCLCHFGIVFLHHLRHHHRYFHHPSPVPAELLHLLFMVICLSSF
jgi:hypothetical protein